MKFSVIRSKQIKEKRLSKQFKRKMTILNPNAKFKEKDNDLSCFICDLSLNDLEFIKIPNNARFETRPYKCKDYGFINIRYKSIIYTIYGKGFETAYLNI